GDRIILARAVSCPGLHGREQAWQQFRDGSLNVQLPLDLWGETLGVRFGAGILEVVQRSSVGDGTDQGSELKGRLLYFFSKAAKHSYAAIGRRGGRIGAGLLSGNI